MAGWAAMMESIRRWCGSPRALSTVACCAASSGRKAGARSRAGAQHRPASSGPDGLVASTVVAPTGVLLIAEA